MSNNIGQNIARLRKEKGIKQEVLANFVGVSAQAVSKWENGGVPDIELLPRIADYFGVSIDSLFDRKMTDYCSLPQAVRKHIGDMEEQERIEGIYRFCWDLEVGASIFIDERDFEEVYDSIRDELQAHSCILYDDGFTTMGIGKQLKYFFVLPEIEDKEKTLFDGIDYLAFFNDISDKDVFNALIFLNKRNFKKAFTEKLLVANLNISAEKAKEVIEVLKKYSFLRTMQLEMDDETREVYSFVPSPFFVAFLIFAKQVIEKPTVYNYMSDNRKKPYLA